MARVSVEAWQCDRCTYIWLPRITGIPKQCPRCHSPYWNEESPSAARAVEPRPRKSLTKNAKLKGK